MKDTGFQPTELLVLIAFIVPAIFFLLTQYKTLSAIRPENRRMDPGWVFLQLVPFLGLIWGFVVVICIAGSVNREISAYRDDSIVGLTPDDVARLNKRPTLAIGLAWCILWVFDLPMLFLTKMDPDVQIFHVFLTLAQMICWIIYWVLLFQLLRNLRKGRL